MGEGSASRSGGGFFRGGCLGNGISYCFAEFHNWAAPVLGWSFQFAAFGPLIGRIVMGDITE